MSPAGTEPRERATWTKPRRGERAGASESIEPARGAILKLPTIWHAAVCPRRERSRGSVRHGRSPEGVSERERANQSNLREELSLSCPRSGMQQYVRGGNGAAGACDMDEAPKG